MVLNPDKSHFRTLYFNDQSPYFSFNKTFIENVIEESILKLVVIDNKNNTYKKSNQKLKALLSHFQPMFYFYTPRKHQKTSDFLMFPVGVTVED